jgi:hypothetical protein
MKNKIQIAFIGIIALCAILISSCERDRCKTRGIECKNDGVCFDGSCNCTSGWEGDSCQFAVNERFKGTYGGILVFKDGFATDDTVAVTPVAGNNLAINFSHKRIKNALIPALVKQNDITIAPYRAANNFTYKGTGSLNKDIYSLTMMADSIENGITYISYEYTFVGSRVQ